MKKGVTVKMAYTYLGKSVLQILFYVYVTFDLIL